LYFNKYKSQREIAKEMGYTEQQLKELSSKEDRRETWYQSKRKIKEAKLTIKKEDKGSKAKYISIAILMN